MPEIEEYAKQPDGTLEHKGQAPTAAKPAERTQAPTANGPQHDGGDTS